MASRDATTLDAPAAVDLVAMNIARNRADACATGFRAMVAGTVTFVTFTGQSESWDVLAGEGYRDLQIRTITFAAGKIRVFF